MPKLAKQTEHVPVLAGEVLEILAPKKGESYLDLTAGYGGHAKLVLEKTKAGAVLIDRDKTAVNSLKTNFKTNAIRIIHQDFLSASQELVSKGSKFDLILADLGVSSEHLKNIGRGFSFNDGLLDMRMDERQALTATEVVNKYSEAKLAALIKDYGEEPKAKQLARLIVKSRPLTSTAELAELARRVWPGKSKVNPATRLFQAIRIEVNSELTQIKLTLPLTLKLLAPGGRLAVISFHSLEDRLVKQFLADHGGYRYDAELMVLTKKPITATKTEIANNPRSRSAKLRAAQRK